jgi:hypothetical protein
LIYDPEKLITSWNKQVGEDLTLGTKDDDKAKINIINETIMGGSLVGFVHLTKMATSRGEQSALATVAQAKVKLAGFAAMLAGASGSTSIATEFGKKAAKMLSESGLQTRFELHCLGALPKIESDKITTSLVKFAEFDPNKLSDPSTGTSNPDDEGGEGSFALKSLAKQSAMSSNIGSSIQSIGQVDNENNESLSFGTFMTAFTDFVNKMTTDDHCGVPVGLNFTTLKASDVIRGGQKTLEDREAEKKEGGGGGGGGGPAN